MINIRKDKVPSAGFYTYVHCRPNGVPFYVGKGSCGTSNLRAYYFRDRNKAHQNCVSKYGRENIHVRIYKRDTEDEAFALEVDLIDQFSKSGFKLYNLAVGGRGGTTGVVPSPESNLKRSLALKGKPHGHGYKISESLTGKVHTEKSRSNFRTGQCNRYAKMSKEDRVALVSQAAAHIRTEEEKLRRSNSIKESWIRRKQNATVSVEKEK